MSKLFTQIHTWGQYIMASAFNYLADQIMICWLIEKGVWKTFWPPDQRHTQTSSQREVDTHASFRAPRCLKLRMPETTVIRCCSAGAVDPGNSRSCQGIWSLEDVMPAPQREVPACIRAMTVQYTPHSESAWGASIWELEELFRSTEELGQLAQYRHAVQKAVKGIEVRVCPLSTILQCWKYKFHVEHHIAILFPWLHAMFHADSRTFESEGQRSTGPHQGFQKQIL